MANNQFSGFSNFDPTEFPNFQQMNGNSLLKFSLAQNDPIPCFREDTNILCYVNEKEIYVKVQDIIPGMRIKTLSSGYLAVSIIGKKKLNNPGDNSRIPNRIYKCTKEQYPEIMDDLFITGHHCILVDDISEIEREAIQDLYGKIYVTENKYRLPCFLDNKSEVFTQKELVDIYHIALENKNYYGNYGIYANGLLVESCSLRYLKELSNMELIV
jgi:hypothetical protein